MARVILSIPEAEIALSRYFDNSGGNSGFPFSESGYVVEIERPQAPVDSNPSPFVASDQRAALAEFVCQVRNAGEGRAHSLISAIKAARTLTGMGLKDAKDFTEDMIRDFKI